MSKIRDIDGMIYDSKRKINVSIVFGRFDLLHIVDVRYLQRQAESGALFVIVDSSSDGVWPASVRAEMLAALECVSCVAIANSLEALKIQRVIRPRNFSQRE